MEDSDVLDSGSDDDDADDDDDDDADVDDVTDEEDVSKAFKRARDALRVALERHGNVDCLTREARAELVESGHETAMEKACKEVGLQAGAVIKKILRKNLALMGARDNLLDTSVSLVDDLKPRESTNPLVNNLDPENFQCRMWDSIVKHNNVVCGRAQAAMDTVENTDTSAATETAATEETEFAQVYRDAFIEAYGDDIDELRKDEKTNVGVILRAIQTGVDIVPELQKQLHLQWASLRVRSQPDEK